MKLGYGVTIALLVTLGPLVASQIPFPDFDVSVETNDFLARPFVVARIPLAGSISFVSCV